MTKRTLTVVFCSVLIVASVLLFIQALGFEAKAINTRTPGTRFFPIVTLSAIVAFSGAVIVKELRDGARSAGSGGEALGLSREQVLRVVLVAATAFLAYFLWDLLGFLPMAYIMVAGTTIILKIRSVWAYGVMAVAVVALYFIFKALEIPLD